MIASAYTYEGTPYPSDAQANYRLDIPPATALQSPSAAQWIFWR